MDNQNQKTSTELTSFIGVFVDSLIKEGYEPSEVKRIISQDLINEALILCDKDGETYDYYALQSLFLSVSYVLSKEVYRLNKEAGEFPQAQSEINKMKSVIEYLENKVKAVNNKK